MGFIIGLSALIVIAIISIHTDDDKHAFYKQQWYNDASKEYGKDYYYPPATHRTAINSSGTCIRTSQHYRPVRQSTYCHTSEELIPWFVDVKSVNGGHENLLERKFN